MKKIEIKIPDIAENVDSGIVAGILVSEGDSVTEDQPLIEVETDKAATDIPSTHDGTVEEIRVEEGEEVKVSQVIMILSVEGEKEEVEKADQSEKKKEEQPEADEKLEAEKEEKPEEKEKPRKEEKTEEKEEPRKQKKAEEEENEKPDKEELGAQPGEEDRPEEQAKEKRESAEVAATPLVRRIAREEGIDLGGIEGSGPHGRITRSDIEELMNRQKGKEKEKKQEEEKESPEEEDVSREKMSRIRQLTAERMQESWQKIPHVTQFDEADITAMEEFRQRQKERMKDQGANLTMTALLLKISGFALQRFPRFNSSLDEPNGEILYKHQVNIGVAVDTDRGLMVPVIRDVDRKSLTELSDELDELAGKARHKKIGADELQGGNFTISNLGGIGGTAFTPIVYSPQVAILGVSRGKYQPVYRGEDLEKRLILPLSLSYDHRVVDGAEGARFLRWICSVLEDPYALLQ